MNGIPTKLSTDARRQRKWRWEKPQEGRTLGCRKNYFNQKNPPPKVSDVERQTEVDLQLKQIGYAFFFRKTGRLQNRTPCHRSAPNMCLDPGDTLRIDVWGSIEGNYLVLRSIEMARL